MSTPIAIVAALGSLLLAAPALADRAGDAPVKAPFSVQTDHVAFTLPGGPWSQVVGGAGATPEFGRYGLEAKLATGPICSLSAQVIGTTSKRPPLVRRRTVRPPRSEVLRFTRQGRRGAVQWWVGATKNFDAAADGVQRIPAHLATNTRRYLIYSVQIGHTASPDNDPRPAPVLPADDRECAMLARKTVARVARTMHIEPGPAVAKPPFQS